MKWLKPIARLLVSATILLLIARAIDPGQAWSALRAMRRDLLVLAVLAQFGSTLVSAYRWKLIMHNLDFGLSLRFFCDSYFKGMFFNQGLPTSIGGDAIRVLDVASRGYRKRDALYGVAVDRIAGLGALLSLTLVAGLLDPQLLPAAVYRPILLLIVLGLLGVLGIASLRRLEWLDRHRSGAYARALAGRFHRAFSRQRLALLASSVLVPLLAVACLLCLGWALGLRYGPMTYFAIVPPALALTVVPVSIAGWGVREGALVGLFASIGADRSAVLMMSLLYGLTLILVSLPGALVLVRGRRGAPRTGSAAGQTASRVHDGDADA